MMTSYEMTLLLSEPYDNNNAILEIHPGSGGTEAQDWGDMLLRMYTRFGNAKGFKVEVLDYQAGDEAGIKSVTLSFEGPHAYGLLKSEMGVHHLVRISPFDSAKRRHTSFTSVEVMPELDDTIEVETRDDDIKMDTFHSGETGGQNVNKVSVTMSRSVPSRGTSMLSSSSSPRNFMPRTPDVERPMERSWSSVAMKRTAWPSRETRRRG